MRPARRQPADRRQPAGPHRQCCQPAGRLRPGNRPGCGCCRPRPDGVMALPLVGFPNLKLNTRLWCCRLMSASQGSPSCLFPCLLTLRTCTQDFLRPQRWQFSGATPARGHCILCGSLPLSSASALCLADIQRTVFPSQTICDCEKNEGAAHAGRTGGWFHQEPPKPSGSLQGGLPAGPTEEGQGGVLRPSPPGTPAAT